jgi:hypothetical protein
MISVLGQPDISTPYQNGTIFNFEYGAALGLNATGVIFHAERDVITRITVFTPALPLLKNGTDFTGWDKTKVYSVLGIPDRDYEEPGLRIFFYDATGIDAMLDGREMTGFSIRLPEKPRNAKPSSAPSTGM